VFQFGLLFRWVARSQSLGDPPWNLCSVLAHGVFGNGYVRGGEFQLPRRDPERTVIRSFIRLELPLGQWTLT
jgi:hypothetical protein